MEPADFPGLCASPNQKTSQRLLKDAKNCDQKTCAAAGRQFFFLFLLEGHLVFSSKIW